STLLALAGGGLGVLLAWAGLKSLTGLLVYRVFGSIAIHLDGRILAFSLLVSLVTGLVFGLAPVLQLLRGSLHDRLKQGERQSESGTDSQRLKQMLVINKIAISLILLASARLLLRSMIRLIN